MSPEECEQVAFFRWARLLEGQHPQLGWLAHWPNGGHRSKAAAGRLKAMGVRRGPLDVWLPLRAGQYVGMAFEFKAPPVLQPDGTRSRAGTLTPEQRTWAAHLAAQGWRVETYTDWQQAARGVAEYLGLRPDEVGL